MRVGINATSLTDRPSGAKQRFIGIYSNLISAHAEINFVIYEAHGVSVEKILGTYKNVEYVQTPICNGNKFLKYLKSKIFWFSVFRKEKFDVFDSLNLPVFCPKNARSILTIHDIRYIYSGFWSWFNKFVLKMALRRANIVVTVSDAMRKEILRFYPRAKVEVIYNGIDIKLFREKSLRKFDFCEKYNIPNDFILAVGHLEKRKNYSRLIDAMHILSLKNQLHCLVIVGNDSGERERLNQKLVDLNLSNQVFVLENLSDSDLVAAYQAAQCLVFPSMYEGFGIPILEAMAASLPIVMSDIEVFREITEGKGHYFSPYDSACIARNIEKLLQSNQDKMRSVVYGEARVNFFDYKNLSKDYVRTYY